MVKETTTLQTQFSLLWLQGFDSHEVAFDTFFFRSVDIQIYCKRIMEKLFSICVSADVQSDVASLLKVKIRRFDWTEKDRLLIREKYHNRSEQQTNKSKLNSCNSLGTRFYTKLARLPVCSTTSFFNGRILSYLYRLKPT